MKRKLLATIVMAMATVGVARADGTNTPAVAATAPAAAPKIQFDKTVYNFGATSLVESVTGTFNYQNVGTADLNIKKPQPSCGCTVASVKPDVLKPGEKGELVFTVRVAGQHGQLEKHITVPSNDPASPSVSLSVKVEMKQILEVTPQQVSVGALRQGVTTNLSVVLRRIDGQKLMIASNQPSSKFLTAHVEAIEGSTNQSVKLVIDAHAQGAPRTLNENVKVFLDGISQPAATVSVNGRLLGDVVLDHEQLYWPVSDTAHAPAQNAQAQPIRRITVSSTRSDQPLQITNLRTSLTNVTVELVTVDTGKVYSVIAKLTDSPTQSERGTISFDTNTSVQPKIVVPVTIIVLKNTEPPKPTPHP
ncbi:MAG: DUF1573 domain-containing protein [Verrucomicrobiia bacterium]|jgi:hypothetical protein